MVDCLCGAKFKNKIVCAIRSSFSAVYLKVAGLQNENNRNCVIHVIPHIIGPIVCHKILSS